MAMSNYLFSTAIVVSILVSVNIHGVSVFICTSYIATYYKQEALDGPFSHISRSHNIIILICLNIGEPNYMFSQSELYRFSNMG